MLQITAIFRT